MLSCHHDTVSLLLPVSPIRQSVCGPEEGYVDALLDGGEFLVEDTQIHTQGVACRPVSVAVQWEARAPEVADGHGGRPGAAPGCIHPKNGGEFGLGCSVICEQGERASELLSILYADASEDGGILLPVRSPEESRE